MMCFHSSFHPFSFPFFFFISFLFWFHCFLLLNYPCYFFLPFFPDLFFLPFNPFHPSCFSLAFITSSSSFACLCPYLFLYCFLSQSPFSFLYIFAHILFFLCCFLLSFSPSFLPSCLLVLFSFAPLLSFLPSSRPVLPPSLLPPPCSSCCGPEEPEGSHKQRQRPGHPGRQLCFRADAQPPDGMLWDRTHQPESGTQHRGRRRRQKYCCFHLWCLRLIPSSLWVPEQKEWIFTYHDSSNNVALSLGSDQSGMKMIVDGVDCPIESIITAADFTSTMKPFCVLWTSSNGRVAVYFNGNYWAKTCTSSSGHSVPAGGLLRLGGKFTFSLGL